MQYRCNLAKKIRPRHRNRNTGQIRQSQEIVRSGRHRAGDFCHVGL